jgi:glycosyltransferase involved in cell wall biosynthesis
MPFKVEILCPCFKRPEYTYQCIKALEEAQTYDNTLFHLWDDCSCDGTDRILQASSLNKRVVVNEENRGLRNILINFLEMVGKDTEFITVVGNDCLMPKNWMNDMLAVFSKSDADILSPDVNPSHAALKLGRPDEGQGYMPSDYVGGLWFMKRSMIDGMEFTRYPNLKGINGAFEILKQIIIDKEPKIGWVPSVVVEDIGHWSGTHPLCIKTQEHKDYYAQVNRRTSW